MVMRYFDGTVSVLETQKETGLIYYYYLSIYLYFFQYYSVKIFHFSPVGGKLYIIIQVIDVSPAVNVNSSSCCYNQYH